MNKENTQTIYCTVDTCEHHDRKDMCMLNSIQVTPPRHNPDPEQDSMCESFERRGD